MIKYRILSSIEIKTDQIPYCLKKQIYTAVQMQQSWASTHNVNLLAANINNPSAGASGSGIYSGHNGALDVFVSGSEETRILKAKVPCDIRDSIRSITKTTTNYISSPVAQSKLKVRQENLSNYAIKFLDFAKRSVENGRLCHGNVCCLYTVEASNIGNSSDTVRYARIIFIFHKHHRHC